MKPLLTILAFILLASCTANTQARQVTRQTGIQAGQPTDLTTTTETKEETSTGMDVGAMISAAVQASQGKILGALDAIKPQPLPEIPSLGAITNAVTAIQKPPGTDWGSLISYGVAALMAALAGHQASAARMQRKEKQIIEADRDKAYDDLIEANRQLPPK
jgi:hypothetical protein